MALRDDLLLPISGGNPSGANLRYDSVTEAIKEARREDLDVAQGAWKTALKSADHRQVIRLGSDALAKRSKDLQIATWLVDAHVRVDGFAALAPCFAFLSRLLEQFWDTLYPEIEDEDVELRAAPLDWLGNKLEYPITLLPLTSSGLSFASYKQSRLIGYEQDAVSDEKQAVRRQAIKEGKATAEEFDEAVNATPRSFYEACQTALTSAIQELQSLSDLCDEKFGDAAPSFLKTRTAIETIAQQVRIFLSRKAPAPEPAPVQAPTPVPVEAVPFPAAAPLVEASAPPQPPAVNPAPVIPAQAAAVPAASTGTMPSGLNDVISRIGVICRYLRESTIYDASAFLVIRALRWGELRAKAPNIEPAMLQGPPPEFRSQLKERFSAKDWEAVLTLTEGAMELPCGRAWLDLQRYAVQALEHKGEYYVRVAASVRTALRALLEELPDLPEQSLSDDTPVANAETRTWIQEQVLSGTALPVASAKTPEVIPPPAPLQPVPVPAAAELHPPELEPDDENVMPDPFEAALAAAASNRAAEAIEMISRQLASERSGRGRFRRRTQLAHLLVMGGHKAIAAPILERLVAEMEQRHLEDWEPGQALAYPVDLLIRCMDINGSDSNERKALYARLCELDPARALKSASS